MTKFKRFIVICFVECILALLAMMITWWASPVPHLSTFVVMGAVAGLAVALVTSVFVDMLPEDDLR